MNDLESWKERGSYRTVLGHQIFVIDEGKSDENLVISHGFPTNSYDFIHVLPILAQKFRVVVHDHLGFGLSDKPRDYSYSLIEQADIALSLWQQLGIKEAHVLGHDYGTSVVTEMVARHNQGYLPIKFKTVTIGNGSMHIEMAKLRLSQRVLRSTTWGPILSKLTGYLYFCHNMRQIWGDKSKIKEEEIKMMWEMLNYNNGRDVLVQVSQYLRDRVKFWHRWVGMGGLRSTDLPVNILWADLDPIAIVAMAHELHKHVPNNKLKLLPGIGHYPMLEEPTVYAEAVLEMIDN